jgi:hypothetical protein
MNRVNSYRGSSKPKSQRITNDTNDTNNNNNNDIQMEGINEFKTLNPNDDNNWADYVDFNKDEVSFFLAGLYDKVFIFIFFLRKFEIIIISDPYLLLKRKIQILKLI